METRQRILNYLHAHESAGGGELREFLGISRQALSVQLRTLLERGEVVKAGSTRAARYSLVTHAPAPIVITRSPVLAGLDESNVYDELALQIGLRTRLRQTVESIVRYGFTEMLNNAIEHSETERCELRFQLDTGVVSFDIRDRGIGVFHSIASKLGLEDEQTAMLELLKGKTTTMEERHTGEGIFFASKVADRFSLRSHRIHVNWDTVRDDVFVSQERFITGTRATFQIRLGTRRRLEDVFQSFAPAEYDFQFQKTRIHVKLLQSEYVSRSEARRLLANLQKFKEVLLDFKGVRSIGQGFADEIFRVFVNRHPGVEFHTENANAVVAAMLRHAGAR